MKRIFYIVSFIACLVLLRPIHGSAEDIYYARCNLKVLKGYYITWLNWQSSPTMVPIGTKFRVVPMGSKAELTEVDTGKTYTLDMGASGKEY
ncbi:MAG: hypothetical protein ACE5GF_08525, partial [Thermodesulfobacteriota bacterium]